MKSSDSATIVFSTVLGAAMDCEPPTARKARTGEFTPPGKIRWARSKSAAERGRLGPGESVVTRDGIWLGPDWLRLSRDADPHTGVIEREESLRAIHGQLSGLAQQIKDLEHRLELTRERVRELEDRRDHFQADVNRLHREHVDRRAELDSAQARSARPNLVRCSRYQKHRTMSAQAANSHSPWEGSRMPSRLTGASPENGGNA